LSENPAGMALERGYWLAAVLETKSDNIKSRTSSITNSMANLCLRLHSLYRVYTPGMMPNKHHQHLVIFACNSSYCCSAS